MRENNIKEAFNKDIELEAMSIYAIPYHQLPRVSQRAIKDMVKDYYTQKIYELTEDE